MVESYGDLKTCTEFHIFTIYLSSSYCFLLLLLLLLLLVLHRQSVQTVLIMKFASRSCADRDRRTILTQPVGHVVLMLLNSACFTSRLIRSEVHSVAHILCSASVLRLSPILSLSVCGLT